ncbi:MAG: Ig-like domain-containing protein, partial [Anaerolineae bacterium]
EQGLAAAETSKPGHCALMGQPLQDLTPPHTTIEVSGERGVDGAFYDMVTVSASASDAGGVAKIEYSLDAGTTWQLYTGPFTILANGIPEPLPSEMEEDFGSGPGRFLVLFSTTDTAGNVEEPPAFRRIVIDPSKAPPPETTPTPTFTITPSPTACVPMATAVLNANVRWGPGLIYDPPVAALSAGESAPIVGKNSDASWWRIDLNPNAATQFWVADSVVDINCGQAEVPVVATPVPPTFTPTPTNTPTPTPTSTPTATPTPTRTRIPDKRAPVVNASYSPNLVWENTPVTFTATAQDNVGVARMEIWIRPSLNGFWFKAQTCTDATFCSYLGGPFSPGTASFIAYAWDASDNLGNSDQIDISVLSIPK